MLIPLFLFDDDDEGVEEITDCGRTAFTEVASIESVATMAAGADFKLPSASIVDRTELIV